MFVLYLRCQRLFFWQGAELGPITLREIVSHFLYSKIMEKILSVFVDESGDTGDSGQTSKYYIVSFVFHNQSIDISSQINRVKNELPFHVGPIIRKEKPYDLLEIKDRTKLLRKILVWLTTIPIESKSFVYTKKEMDFNKNKLLMKLARDIYNFLESNKDYFTSFDKIIVYYDKGQQVVDKALLQSFGIIGFNVEFKADVKAEKYRLFQLTDFVCSLKLIETKMNNRELSKYESIFFNDPKSFKKYYLKALRKKQF